MPLHHLQEFKKIVNEIRKLEIIMGSDEKKCQDEELQMSKVSRKSLTLKNSLKKGDKINLETFMFEKTRYGYILWTIK